MKKLFPSLQKALLTGLTAVVAASTALPSLAETAYPERQIRLVVPFPAGGNTDLVARLIGQKMSDDLGQSVVIDNRPGAGGNIGSEAVVRAEPDGYTLLASTLSTYALNVGLYDKLSFDPRKDLTPVGMTVLVPLILVVPASLDVDNLQEFIAMLKEKPGAYSYGSAGNGTSSHIALYLFNKMAGTEALHVPYRGTSPVITDLLAGRLDFAIDAPSVLAPYIESGKLKALAVALPERLKSLPQIPTMAEAGLPDYEAYSWNAVWAPAGTPDEVLNKLRASLDKAVHDPELETRLNDMGALPFDSMTREETAKYMAEQFDKWVPLVRESGAKVE